MIHQRMPVLKPKPLPGERAHRTCDRLKFDPHMRARFLGVFGSVRAAELNGEDTEPLLRAFLCDTDVFADVDVAAYMEAVASTREPYRPKS